MVSPNQIPCSSNHHSNKSPWHNIAKLQQYIIENFEWQIVDGRNALFWFMKWSYSGYLHISAPILLFMKLGTRKSMLEFLSTSSIDSKGEGILGLTICKLDTTKYGVRRTQNSLKTNHRRIIHSQIYLRKIILDTYHKTIQADM